MLLTLFLLDLLDFISYKKISGLSITIQCNLKSVDFLDVTFDLYNNLYKPYREPNDNPIYINKQSNHPPNVLKQLPKSIAKR